MGTGSFQGVKAAGAWPWSPTPFSAGVRERLELFLYSSFGPSWSVLGRTSPLPSVFTYYCHFHVYLFLNLCHFKPAQQAARGKHVAHCTVLCCPVETFEMTDIFEAFLWKSWDIFLEKFEHFWPACVWRHTLHYLLISLKFTKSSTLYSRQWIAFFFYKIALISSIYFSCTLKRT
jgi:hypothetical protein